MITSMQNKTIKELLKLKQKKYRKDYYLVETNHLVEEAIKAKQTDLVVSTEPVDLGVENLVVSKEIMEKLAFNCRDYRNTHFLGKMLKAFSGAGNLYTAACQNYRLMCRFKHCHRFLKLSDMHTVTWLISSY